MPHYDYKCTDCGYQFELFQKMKDEPVTFCPSCGGKVKRLIGTGAGAIFKGSGFYHTDYKMKGEGKKQSKKTDTPSDPKPQEGKKDKKQTD